MVVTPMFPLGSVLVPGMALPLHIFEERYQRLLADCLESDGTFGVVLIERGSEVGGGEARFDVGTRARIEEHQTLGPGRHAVVASGVERIRVTRWLEDDPHPRAEIEAWPDDIVDEDVVEAYTDCTARLRHLLALAGEHGAPVAAATFDAPQDPSAGSYLLSGLAPIGPLDRQRLLEAPSVRQRLERLDELIADQLTLLTGT